jgi:hypothetical protein
VVGNVTTDLNKETITIETSLSDTVKDRLSTIEQVASASLNDLNTRIIAAKERVDEIEIVTAGSLNNLNADIAEFK